MANGNMFVAPQNQGGNDPIRQAAIQNSRTIPQGPAPVPQPGAAMPGMGAPGPVGNEVAFHLANAFDALMRTGPTSENLAALEQFMGSIQQAVQGGGQAGPPAAGMQPPAMGAPVPPLPMAGTPLPA